MGIVKLCFAGQEKELPLNTRAAIIHIGRGAFLVSLTELKKESSIDNNLITCTLLPTLPLNTFCCAYCRCISENLVRCITHPNCTKLV